MELIRVGVVGRAHGISGAVRVFTDEPGSTSLLKVGEVYLGGPDGRREVEGAERCGRFIALKILGVDDRDEAFGLTGSEVFIRRDALGSLRGDVYYACDLVGLSVVGGDGRNWGVVDSVMPGAAHDILRYRRPGGGEGFIPFVSAHVGRVDFGAGTVEVDSDWMSQLDGVYGG